MSTIPESIKENWLVWYVVIYGGESFAAADSMTLKQLVDYKNVLIIKSKIEKFMMQKDTSENES